jgi:hypothetical protein
MLQAIVGFPLWHLSTAGLGSPKSNCTIKYDSGRSIVLFLREGMRLSQLVNPSRSINMSIAYFTMSRTVSKGLWTVN